MQVQCVLSLLPCARQGDFRLLAKHFATKDVESFSLAIRIRSFKLLRVTGFGGR